MAHGRGWRQAAGCRREAFIAHGPGTVSVLPRPPSPPSHFPAGSGGPAGATGAGALRGAGPGGTRALAAPYKNKAICAGRPAARGHGAGLWCQPRGAPGIGALPPLRCLGAVPRYPAASHRRVSAGSRGGVRARRAGGSGLWHRDRARGSRATIVHPTQYRPPLPTAGTAGQGTGPRCRCWQGPAGPGHASPVGTAPAWHRAAVRAELMCTCARARMCDCVCECKHLCA